jgi:predicted kinase
MPTLILICGLPGAGKTTLAKRLEREWPALRLTPDERMSSLGIDGSDEPRRTAVEALQWEVAQRALLLGADAVLDWGFWSRVERDDYRERARELGVRFEVRFVDVPGDELLKRLTARNANLPPATFHIDLAQLEEYYRVFEPPTADELAPSDDRAT